MMNKEQYKQFVKAFYGASRSMVELEVLTEEFHDNAEILKIIEPTRDKANELTSTLHEFLIDETEKLFGVSDDDFIGDGYFQIWMEVMNGEMNPEELISEFESIDLKSQREWVVGYNLSLLKEFYTKMRKFEDLDRSNKIYNARINVLLDKARVPSEESDKYIELLHKFADGRVSEKEVINAFRFYTNR